MNEVKLFKEITEDMLKLYEAKNTDYGSSVSDTYRDFGLVSFLVRIQDKLNRLKLSKRGALVVDEKIEDTLIDMANYSILALIELRKDEVKRNGQRKD